MRIEELLRGMIELVDQMQLEVPNVTPEIVVAHPVAVVTAPPDVSPLTHAGDDINRFRQIVDLADKDLSSPIGNTPNEKIASIDSVTIDAGGGMNGPKQPHDLRVKDPSMYPNQQEC